MPSFRSKALLGPEAFFGKALFGWYAAFVPGGPRSSAPRARANMASERVEHRSDLQLVQRVLKGEAAAEAGLLERLECIRSIAGFITKNIGLGRVGIAHGIPVGNRGQDFVAEHLLQRFRSFAGLDSPADHRRDYAQYLQTVSDIGYVVIDVESEYSEIALDALRSVEGTLRCRVLF